MDADTRAASSRSKEVSDSLNAFNSRGLNIDDADQLAAREHRHGEFASHRIEGRQIARIVSDVVDHDCVPRRGGGAGDAFAQEG